MATTFRMSELNTVRFVKQVSSECLRSKHSYLAMQNDLKDKLDRVRWREAETSSLRRVTTVVNAVTKTNILRDSETGKIINEDYTAYIDDAYDAFKQGGDGDKTTGMMCGYAGRVMYRIEMPYTWTLTSGQTDKIEDISFVVAMSRYLRSGVKLRWCLSEGNRPEAIAGTWQETSSVGCDDVLGVHSWGLGAQNDVQFLTASRAREASVSWSDKYSGDHSKYLWIDLALEDYTDYWTLYDAVEARNYSIEGSAAMVLSASKITISQNNVQVISPDVWIDTNFTAADMAGFHVSYQGKPAYSEEDIEKYGNFVTGCMKSVLYVPATCRQGSYVDANATIGCLSSFADYPRKNFFDKDIGIEIGSIFPARKLSEICVFAGCRVEYGMVNDAIYSTDNYNHDIMSATITMLGNAAGIKLNSYIKDEKLYNPACLELRSKTVTVVPFASSYSKIKFQYRYTDTSMIKMGMNIWRVRSNDAKGVFAMSILSAICSYQTIFTGAQDTVNASLVGDGTITQDMTINASATLIGYMPLLSSMSTQESEVFLTSEIRGGDVLIFAPKIEILGYFSEVQTKHCTQLEFVNVWVA